MGQTFGSTHMSNRHLWTRKDYGKSHSLEHMTIQNWRIMCIHSENVTESIMQNETNIARGSADSYLMHGHFMRILANVNETKKHKNTYTKILKQQLRNWVEHHRINDKFILVLLFVVRMAYLAFDFDYERQQRRIIIIIIITA